METWALGKGIDGLTGEAFHEGGGRGIAAAELVDHIDAPFEGFDPGLGVYHVGAAVFVLADAAVFHGVDEQLIREAGRKVGEEAVAYDPISLDLV